MKEYVTLANALTSGNLVAGFFAVLLIFRGEYYPAAGLIALAALFDALDGAAARRSENGNEAFGTNLDSLADVVSFGAAPALALYMQLAVRVAGLRHRCLPGLLPVRGLAPRPILDLQEPPLLRRLSYTGRGRARRGARRLRSAPVPRPAGGPHPGRAHDRHDAVPHALRPAQPRRTLRSSRRVPPDAQRLSPGRR